MVAVIHTSARFRAVLTYNERKVEQENARCLAAENYPKEVDELSFKQKLSLLEKFAELNQSTKVNCVHISLNFDPSEKLKADQLTRIASTYMDKIGFANQPFLVYEHYDAAHPHLHVLTTNIRSDGSRIPLHNLGRNQSEKARKEIEIAFNLVKAQGRSQQVQAIRPAIIKADYGKTQTKTAISNVLNAVIDQYKYTSLPELNAVLRQYNVFADRGSEGSRTHQKNGLLFFVLDDRGVRTGVPIKASDFYQKPTLRNLEKRFEQNETSRQQFKSRVKNAIDLAFLRRPNTSIADLQKILKQQAIDTITRVNDNGQMYGITYVDHQTRCVFNGSSLGKTYSANAIQQRCLMKSNSQVSQSYLARKSSLAQDSYEKNHTKTIADPSALNGMQWQDITPGSESGSLLDPVKQEGCMPHRLRKTRRKRQRKFTQHL